MAIRKFITINGRQERTLEYNRFIRMRRRCLSPKDAAYADYGGRGIKICRGWNSFEKFLSDIGVRPTSKHSLDRIDNDGHYSCGSCDECAQNGWPMNCRWATQKEQSNNTRHNVRLTHNGRTLTLMEWARELGVSDGTLYARHCRGLTAEQILAPVKTRKAYPRRRRINQPST